MDRITAARVLIETVERGSATAAAEALDMSRAMASRYIASIEDWSGTRLLHRTTRQLSLTSAGERVLELCKDMVRIADAVSDVAADAATPRGRLRVTAPSILAEALLISLLADFAKAYQHIKIDLLISDRPVDLVQDRIDVAIRIANSLDPSLIAKRLGSCPSGLYAAPTYLTAHGQPGDVDDLKGHQCLTYANLGGAEWVLENGRTKSVIQVSGGFQTNDALALRRAAISAMGIAMLPRFSAETDVAEGRLRRVLEEWQPESMGIHALYVSRHHLPTAARVLIDFLSGRMNH
ncbi:LysR family transcriptional regulator [Segnochrobactraceae bacterium EtOH-i3]